MVLSFSKRDRRTHWWNFVSSNSTDLLLPPTQNDSSEGAKLTLTQQATVWVRTSQIITMFTINT